MTSSSQRSQSKPHSKPSKRLFLVCLILLSKLPEVSPQLSSVNEKGEDCFSDDSDYMCVNKFKKHSLENLVFLTPWNKVGYELALQNAFKLDIISPVWFYLEKSKETGKFTFQGRQDIDKELLKKLKGSNPNLKILPRFYVSGLEEEFKWFISPENMKAVLGELAQIKKEISIDGYVFDMPLLNRLKYKGPVKTLLDKIETDMGKEQGYYNAVTFAGYRISITQAKEEIAPYLRVFSRILVCTYDYPNKTFDRWLAPISWVSDNLSFYTEIANFHNKPLSTFIFGVPFYGYLVDSHNFTSRQLQISDFKLLTEGKAFSFSLKQPEGECYWRHGEIFIFYPCLVFLRKRLGAFKEAGFGGFVWDGGQGPYYFYRLL